MTVMCEALDRDLAQRVTQYLSDRHHPGLRSLNVEAMGGTVTIHGTVRTFYEKQLCQHICRRVAGVMGLVDKVVVSDAAEPAPPRPMMLVRT